MDITAPFVLRGDVLFVPVADLDDQVRAAIDCADDDVALTRPRSRTPSTVVEASAARLLEQFRTPRTVVEALVRFGRTEGHRPDDILEDAYALLIRLLQSGFVVPAAADGATPEPADDGPVLQTGTRVADVTVTRAVYVLEDTDLYLACAPDGRALALKLQRPGSQVGALFQREAAVLRHLAGRGAPRLEGDGQLDGLPYLLMEWCSGVDAEAAAAEHRGEPDERTGILRVLHAIVQAYASLHDAGVLHGDVHARNILLGADGKARLVDFGFAVLQDADDPAPGFARGGIPFFYEPEFAAAALAGQPPPAATAAGEQYAVAALLYQLVTGVYYLDFSMGREAMLTEVVERAPVPFAGRRIAPWPELEAVLFRALEKEPGRRFPSMADFARAIGDLLAEPIDVPDAESARPPANRLPVIPPVRSAADELLARLAIDGELLTTEPPRGPVASVNYGAAGIAYALYRIAAVRADPDLLSLADVWCTRAEALSKRPDAFVNADLELTAETIGEAAPLHAASGVAAARAALARAMADDAMHAAAVAAFVDGSATGHKGFDLTLGRAGTVLGTALMLDALPAAVPADPLLRLGRDHLAAIWSWLDGLGDIADGELPNLGIAHGWAGLLYATLQWHRAAADPLPPGVADRLDQLARLGAPSASTRGIAWPWSLDTGDGATAAMPGWCNGTAGHVALWCLAHDVLREPRYLEHALAAAWDVWDAPDAAGSLCCGLAGRSWALLRVHRSTGEEVWLRRARRLGERAVRFGQFEEEFPFSLYKGRLAIAVLATDLDAPEHAVHPFFEEERWPKRPAENPRLTLHGRDGRADPFPSRRDPAARGS